MYLSCRCLLTFLLTAFLLDCTLSTQPTVLSLRTVGDACLVVSSEFYYILPHCLAVFSIHRSYCTSGHPFQISSKTSNQPFVSPLRHSSLKRLSYTCVYIYIYIYIYMYFVYFAWFSKHAFTFVSQSFMSGINTIPPPSVMFNNSIFYSGFITMLCISFASLF